MRVYSKIPGLVTGNVFFNDKVDTMIPTLGVGEWRLETQGR